MNAYKYKICLCEIVRYELPNNNMDKNNETIGPVKSTPSITNRPEF